jgi:hypothetical protein
MEVMLALVVWLLEANSTLINHVYKNGDNILQWACWHSESESGVSVISKYNDTVEASLGSVNAACNLWIYYDILFLTLNVLKLFLEIYPESL